MKLNFFFLPFKRLDTNLGWNAEVNSLRAHYAEIQKHTCFLNFWGRKNCLF